METSISLQPYPIGHFRGQEIWGWTVPELPGNGPGTVWFATVNVASVCLTGSSRKVVFTSHYALFLYVCQLYRWMVYHMRPYVIPLPYDNFHWLPFSDQIHSGCIFYPQPQIFTPHFFWPLTWKVRYYLTWEMFMLWAQFVLFYSQILFSAFWALRLMQEFKYFTNVASPWNTHPLLFVL